MKILHFIYDHINNPWVGGGGAVRVYEIYKRLSEKDHKITVISGKYKGAKDYKVNENFEYRFVGTDRNYILSTFSYAFASFSLLKKIYKDYDIIIEDFAPWNPIFSFRFKSKPIVLQLHHKEGKEILKRYSILGIPFYLFEIIYPKLFKKIITVSFESKKKFNVEAKIISNGIQNINYDLSEGHYIAYIGRIDIYNKGLDVAIESFSQLDLNFKIAGKGKDEDKIKSIIKSKNYCNISYVGYLSENKKIEFIKNSLFLIMPSRFEGQGIVALEAAAMGKPVIVSDIPELKYIVENGFGLSFKSGDYKDLREKIIYLFNNPELIREMGQKGIEYAKNFLWDNIALQYEKYLMEVVRNYD